MLIFESRAVEAITNIFWLGSWAAFAGYATALNVAGRTLARRQGVIVGLRGSAAAAGTVVGTVVSSGNGVDLNASGLGPEVMASSASAVSAAKIAVAVDAALGAVVWVSFIVTGVMTGE